MPVYDYRCVNCDVVCELFNVDYAHRGEQVCPTCGTRMGLPTPSVVHLAKEPYQMKAVMSGGDHVKGHFGKEAKLDKSGRRKK